MRKACGSPTPTRLIPQNQLNDYGKRMHALTPDPTNSVNPFEGPNFQNYYPATNDTNQFTIKGDHVLTERDNLTGRFTRSSNSNILQGGRYGFPPPGCDNCGGSGLSDAKVFNSMFRWTHTFSPTLISETELSNHRSVKDSGTLGNDTPWADMLGLPNPFGVTGWPTIYGADPFLYYGGWDGDNRKDENLTSYQIDENITWIKGKHSMQFGTKLRQEYNNIQELQQAQGSHDFYSDWTSQWDPVNETAVPYTGFGLASTLLGTPTGLRNQANRGFFYFQQFEMGLYFHDSWKVSPRLTLELGVRYDRWAPYGEKRNRLSNLDLSTLDNTFQVVTPGDTRAEDISGILPSMLQSYANRGLSWVTADSIGFPSHLVPADNNNFGPRLGVGLPGNRQAGHPWRLRRVFLDHAAVADSTGGAHQPAVQPAVCQHRYRPERRHAVLRAHPRSAGQRNPAQRHRRYQLGGGHQQQCAWAWTCGMSTIGKTTACRTGTSRSSTRSWRTRRCASATSVRTVWISNRNSRSTPASPNGTIRPAPVWRFPACATTCASTRIGRTRGTNHTGYSNSNSLQAEIERRYSNGLAFQWFYTFTRALTTSDAGGFSSGGGSINASGGGAVLSVPQVIQLLGAPNLSYDDRLRLGYQNSGDVPAHRIRWNAIYDLPFGKGKKYGNSASGALNQLIGGWQIASIGSWRSGLWKNVNASRYLFGDPTLDKDQRLEADLRRPPATRLLPR